MSTTLRRSLIHVLIVVGALFASTLVATPSASAMSPSTRHLVLKIAKSKKGTPYRYGATGPRSFDCSGYTRWVFARVGRHLPRTSRAQSAAVRHVSRSHRRSGDLVFFSSHGRVYHVGIYAGRNSIWHAPHTGSVVHRERLWTSRGVSYGRVR
jgi:cell wall-associated NlpC family hydrolase